MRAISQNAHPPEDLYIQTPQVQEGERSKIEGCVRQGSKTWCPNTRAWIFKIHLKHNDFDSCIVYNP